jgi:hypothetical protein
MFNPVGAIIQAILMIYDTVMFFIENINRILDFVEAVISSFYKIATGAIGEAANWIEKALANTIPIIIAFLARLLGISGITDKIVSTIKKLQARVDKAVDKVIEKIVGGIKKVAGAGKRVVAGAVQKIKDFVFPSEPFEEADGAKHTLTVDRKGEKGELVVHSSTSPVANYLYKLKPEIDAIGNARNRKTATNQYNKALAQRTKAADTLAEVFVPKSGKTKPEQELFKETSKLLGYIKTIWKHLGVKAELLEDDSGNITELEVGTFGGLGKVTKQTAHHAPQNAILNRVAAWLEKYLVRAKDPAIKEHRHRVLGGLGVNYDELKGYRTNRGICVRMEILRHEQTRTYGKLPGDDLDIPKGSVSDLPRDEWVKWRPIHDERMTRFVHAVSKEMQSDKEDVFAIYTGRKGVAAAGTSQLVTARVKKLEDENVKKWGRFLR